MFESKEDFELPAASQEEQVAWLGSIYKDLSKISQAIIVDSVTAADDVTSNAVESIMRSIRDGKCKAKTIKHFAGWARAIVRNACTGYFTKYTGDVIVDVGQRRLKQALGRVTDSYSIEIDAEEFSPYERYEDAE